MKDSHRQSMDSVGSDPDKKAAGNARFSTSASKKPGKNSLTGRQRNAKQGTRDAKRPRKVTRDYLMNYATWYLERFTASRARLEKLMRGKIRLSVAEYGTDPEQAEDWMKSVLATCEQAGFINDTAYAIGRARSLLRKGKAIRVIAADLNARGIDSTLIDATMTELRAEADQAAHEDVRGSNPDLAAAAAYARRRRLGPWRRPDIRAEKRDKDLAALARQGFGYDTATKIIEGQLDDLNDLLSMIDGI